MTVVILVILAVAIIFGDGKMKLIAILLGTAMVGHKILDNDRKDCKRFLGHND